MAPVIAIGSSALVAGTAAMAGATAKKAINPTITISEAAQGAFRFALNGTAVSFKGSSGRFTAKIGINHVTEISAPAMYRSLSSIVVSPASAKVSSSLKTYTVAVRLAAGKSATVRFANEKLVVVVPSPTPAPPSSPGPSSPPPSNPGPSSPPVSNPDPVATSADPGYVEICKSAADGWVEGNFPFTIVAGTTSTTYQVAVGSCTGPIEESVATVSITEGAEGPGYSLVKVTTAPATGLGTVDLAAQTATINVTAGIDTTADFTNATNLNTFKVCKTLLDNMGNLAGQSFNYNVAWTYTPANGAAPISGTGTVDVTAVAAPGTACTVFNNAELGIPVGSKIWVTEGTNVPDVNVTSISVLPASDDAGSTATQAVLTEPALASGYANAMFTNDPMGWVEVCKKFDPWYYNGTNTASFSVNGGAAITVQGGACSAPVEVPAGTATVSELGTSPSSLFFLEYVSTVSASDPVGTRLLTDGGPSLADPNTLPANPAMVTVPYGNVSNETVVTFTNTVDPTQFKICKQEDSSNANLSGQTFNFSWSYEPGILGTADANDVDSRDSVSLTIGPVPAGQETPGGLVCSGLIWGPPAINSDGSVNPIVVTEQSTTLPGVQADGYTLQGNGKVVDSSSFPAVVSGGTAFVEFTPAAGENVLTFTNGRTPPAPTTAG